jgi:ATP-binding cassette subfamily C protein
VSDSSIILAIKKLLSLLSVSEKWRLGKMMGFSFCISILEMITATMIVVLAQIINKPESGAKYISYLGFRENLAPYSIVLYFALGVALIYFIKNALATVEVFFQHFSIQRMNYRFKKKLLHRFAQVDYNLYLTRNSAQGFAVVSSDADLTFSSGLVSLTIIFSETVIFLSLVSMIIYLNPLFAFFMFAIGGILGLGLVKGLFPLFYGWGQNLQEYAVQSNKNLFQFFHAFKEIVLIGKRDSFINAYHFYSRKKSQVQAIQNVTNILPRMITEVLFVGLFVLSIGYFCLNSADPQQMMGILGGYLYAGFRLMPGLNRIITQLNTFKSIIPSIDRVHHEYHYLAQKENYVDCPALTFHHSLNLKNVSFHYLNTTRYALQQINLTISKGECIGIIGETGSGKSTLTDIILGLLKPNQGEILVDNKFPVNSYQWHSRIGYVPQSVYLVDDTIAANVAFGDAVAELNHEKLQQAIHGAQLQQFIEKLPNGLNTMVGERGVQLSGGERQRIAIARALYRDPEILIFDEATSALDNETESRLMDTIDAIHQKQLTIIMIAHRLTTLKNCSRIVVMKNGIIDRIISYNELSKTKNIA